MTIAYENPFTLDDRIKVPLGVTKTKVAAVKQLTQATMRGDRSAKGLLEESLTTSDAIFNWAHLVNLNVLAQYPEQPRRWREIATTRSVSDFKPATLYSLNPDWKDGGVLGSGVPRHIAPPIPEGQPYPYATLSGEESTVGGVTKKGFKVGFTFEAFINDSIGFIQALPDAMRQVALDTEEWEIFTALIAAGTTANDVAGGPVPTGATVTANPVLSRDALIRALIELGNRTVNGRQVSLTGGFKLVVPIGQAIFANFILNQTLGSLNTNPTAGTPEYVYSINGYNPLAGIQVVETEYVTGNAWYLVPNVGSTGGRPLLELLQLVGHELPELRVENATGTYVGGGAISPFEGSFANDSADFRVRTINRGIVWTPELIIWSSGAGV